MNDFEDMKDMEDVKECKTWKKWKTLSCVLAFSLSCVLLPAQPAAVLADPDTGAIFRPAAGISGNLTGNVTVGSGKTLTYAAGASFGGSASEFRTDTGLAHAYAAIIQGSLNIACWGDSLTQGSTGIKYPEHLQTLSGFNTYNGGVSGETSTQIRTRMVADTAKAAWMTIIWAGRNNYASPTTVKADVAAMVAALGHDRYLILGVVNGDYANEYSGQANHTTITTLNSDLATIYGDHFIDIRSYMVAQYDPEIPGDVTDHANDVPPGSLRFDELHYNEAGRLLVAARVYQAIATLQGTVSTVVTPQTLVTAFATPAAIGGTTPNAGGFTDVTAETIAASGAISGSTLTLSGMTSGRVPYTGTAGLLVSTANLAWDSSNGVLTAQNGTNTGSIMALRTAGSMYFDVGQAGAGTSLTARINGAGTTMFVADATKFLVNPATASTTKDNGAVVVENGGLGVEGAGNFGGNITVGEGTTGSRVFTIRGTTGAFALVTNPLGQSQGYAFQQTGVGNTWTLYQTASAAANLEVTAYDDSGTLIDKPLTIVRSSGGAASWVRPISTTKYYEGTEQAASPDAPSSNGFRLYAKDNGSGKTVLYVRFASGAEQQIAIEP